MASFSNKKIQRNLNESDSSDNETEAPFPRFIIIESNSAPITNLSAFIIEKDNINKLNANYSQKTKKSNSACRSGKEEIRCFSFYRGCSKRILSLADRRKNIESFILVFNICYRFFYQNVSVCFTSSCGNEEKYDSD